MKRSLVARSVLITAFLALLPGCGGGGASVQTGPAVIPATTKVLDSASTQALSAISTDGGEIIFSSTTPQIEGVAVGDIISSGPSAAAPSGFLKKVTSITKSGNVVVVKTSSATIEEAVQKGSWTVTQSLSSNDTVKSLALAKGVALTQSTTLGSGNFLITINNVVLYDADGNMSTSNDQIVANGSINIEPSYTFSGEIDYFKVKNLKFSNTTKETCSISLSSNVSLADISETYEIAKYTMPPVVIDVGIPITVTPVLTVNVGLTGNVSVGISSGLVQNASFTNGLSYNDSNGWSTIKDQNHSYTFTPPTLTAGASAKCFAGPKLELLMYGCAGPYASADGYLKLDADPSKTPWWQLYGGIEATAGVEIAILSHAVASYQANIFDERKLLSEADSLFSQNSISGRATSGGIGLPSATITLSGTSTSSTVTDSAGGYSFSNLANGIYSITATKAGYSFSPSSIPLTLTGANATGQDFSANTSQVVHSLTGKIHVGNITGPILSGATVTIANKTSVSDNSGSYSIADIPTGTYTLTVSKPGYSTYTNTAYAVSSNQSSDFYLLASNNYSISGVVSLGGVGLAGITINASNGSSAVTTSSGSYTFTGLSNGNYTLTPNKSGFVFSPSSRSVTVNGSNLTGHNFFITSAPRFVDKSNGAIYDTVANLTWLKNANCFGGQTWYNATARSNNLASGQCGLSDGSKAGNWRLPTQSELITFTEAEYQYDQQGTSVFTNLVPGYIAGYYSNYYWTSEVYFGNTDAAWEVQYGGYGYEQGSDKTSYAFVWPVRSGQ